LSIRGCSKEDAAGFDVLGGVGVIFVSCVIVVRRPLPLLELIVFRDWGLGIGGAGGEGSEGRNSDSLLLTHYSALFT